MARKRQIKIDIPVIAHIVIDVDKFDVPTMVHFGASFDAHALFGDDLPSRVASGIKEIKKKCESSPEHHGAS